MLLYLDITGIVRTSFTCDAVLCLQVASCEIEFNAKISSVTTSELTTDTKVGVEASVGFGGPMGIGFSASMKTSVSHQRTEKNSNTEQREFSMRVFVKAVQEDIPTGLKKILDILETAIIISLNAQRDAAAA